MWNTVGPQVYELVKTDVKTSFSVDPARFLTHGEDEEDTLGPVVVWIAVHPASTSPDTAHKVSQFILKLLEQNGVENAEVEWHEAVTSRLIGPPLLPVVNSNHPTVHVRRHLTATLGIPIATEEREVQDAQGTLGFFFHENRDKNGHPSNKVFGVSNHHVLRKTVEEQFEFKGAGACPQYVRVCGRHRFKRDLDEIEATISRHFTLADLYARQITKSEKKLSQAKWVCKTQRKLDKEKRAITALQDFRTTLMVEWSDIAQRNIGHVDYCPPISVGVKGERYTEDWGTFELDEKFKDQFRGNVVDLGVF